MSDRTHTGVLGGGSWGTAIAHLLRSGEHPTLQWLRDEESARAIREDRRNPRYFEDMELAAGIETTTRLEEIAERCELVFVVVPTTALRQVVRTLGDHLEPDHLLVTCSKGLEEGSAKRMTEVIREETCCLRVGALSGPNLAKEILQGHPSATVVASHYEQVVSAATRVLRGPTLRVYGNEDVLGVELGGALKNVIAIAAGVAAGLGYGDNTKAMLITRGLAEIRRYGARVGAQPMTFAGLAGVGDLMVTCASPLSRNNQVGRRLATGQSLEQIRSEMKQVAEGLKTAQVMREESERLGVFMPITRAVYEVAFEEKPAREAIADLMAIDASYEVDRPIAL